MTMVEWLLVQPVHESNDCLVRKDPNSVPNSLKCKLCDFRSTEEGIMEKHIEENHEELSKTPPFKKRKKETEIDCDETDMETDEKEDLIKQVEKLSIDEKNENEKEEEKKRSELMDKKVIQKQKRYDEEELFFNEKRKREEESRKKLENEAFVVQKKRRKSPKKNKKKIYIKENTPVKRPVGIEEINEKYHVLVGDNKLKFLSK